MEILIAVLALAVMIKLNRKPAPVAKPVRKNARFGATAVLTMPTAQEWIDGNGWGIHDLNSQEDLELVFSY